MAFIKMTQSFYLQQNVLNMAQSLLGKYLCSWVDNSLTCGIIQEVEAYAGIGDPANHAYKKITKRAQFMQQTGSIAYVYLCYGKYPLFNALTNIEGIADACLIRSIHPIEGISTMLQRREKKSMTPSLTKGPGKVAQALGISLKHNGVSLCNETIIWIEEKKSDHPTTLSIHQKPRIGIEYAGEAALWNWNFSLSHPL